MADRDIQDRDVMGDEILVAAELPSENASRKADCQDEVISEDNPWLPAAEESGILTRVSGLLFVASRPLSFNAIKQAVNASPEEVETALEEVRELYRDELHGFSLHEVAGGFQFRTALGVSATIRRHKPPKQRRISKAAAETLAIIAYKQPVQRSEIEKIRGVDALPTLKTLLDNKLIRVVGHEDSVGQPALYGTTIEFLEVFGLSDLTDLPSIRELTELAHDPGEADLGDELLSTHKCSESAIEETSEITTDETQLH